FLNCGQLWRQPASRNTAALALASLREIIARRFTEETHMAGVMIADALKGKVPAGETVTVKGWVRTRRDSKGGFSFVHVNDGSCFDSIQAVCPNTLPNYQDQVMKLTSGCAVEISGKLVASTAKGQSVEIQAEQVKVDGWVDDPETYP